VFIAPVNTLADVLAFDQPAARGYSQPPRLPGDPLDRRVRKLTWQLVAQRTKTAYEIALHA